jgi:D-tyrosyl-tRNA(Tyr) deacylase
MRAVIQRVKSAEVLIENSTISSINKGLLVLVGFCKNDAQEDYQKISNKILNLRIFEDDNNKMNLSVLDIMGEILIVSQFTLFAQCKNGNRPSFIDAAPANHAENIYNEFVNYFNNQYINIKTGKFRAMMDICLINNGPVTIQLDSKLL